MTKNQFAPKLVVNLNWKWVVNFTVFSTMMCLINLCLNGLLGEVCWMDTLMNHFYAGWRIELHPEKAVPYIREITKEESYLVLRLPEKKEELVKKQAASQQLLFEF